MARLSRDELFLEVAQLFALRSTCLRGQVGAVIVKDNRIISTGYNGAPPGLPHCLDVGCEGVEVVHETLRNAKGEAYGTTSHAEFPNGCTRATHAEANAVAFAARQGAPCVDAVMYCTHSMCATCSALVVACGIVKVVYRKPYRLTAGLELLDKANVEVVQYGLE